ncbi:MAG: hypothetical protein VB140_04110 [Burkholderia sp.]
MLHKSSARTQWHRARFMQQPPVDLIASSRSIYATTPMRDDFLISRSRISAP